MSFFSNKVETKIIKTDGFLKAGMLVDKLILLQDSNVIYKNKNLYYRLKSGKKLKNRKITNFKDLLSGKDFLRVLNLVNKIREDTGFKISCNCNYSENIFRIF